jgi:hypothetical protein
MTGLKDQMLRAVAHNSANKVAELAGEFVHAAPQEKEAIQAGIDFERWLAETCQEYLEEPVKS